MKNEYIGLWTLLTVALAAFIGFSCLEPVTLAGVELKSSGIADRLTRPINTPEVDSPALADDSGMTKTVTDTAAKNILLIGDSMLEGINPRLAAYAKENGHTLNSVIWYSSTTAYWGNCDTLRVFLRRFKPDYIFVSLGANELFVKDIIEKREGCLKYFLEQIGDIPYLWIGPPNWKKDTGINEMIARNVKPGCYFRSDGIHFDRTKDGAHPTHASAALWVDSIARWMPLHSSHPIKMKTPAIAKSRPSSVTVLQPLKQPLPMRH